MRCDLMNCSLLGRRLPAYPHFCAIIAIHPINMVPKVARHKSIFVGSSVSIGMMHICIACGWHSQQGNGCDGSLGPGRHCKRPRKGEVDACHPILACTEIFAAAEVVQGSGRCRHHKLPSIVSGKSLRRSSKKLLVLTLKAVKHACMQLLQQGTA